MVQLTEFQNLSGVQRSEIVAEFGRDTGLPLEAFRRVLKSIPFWDAETGEPFLDFGKLPTKG